MDHRIKLAREHFGIKKPDEWQKIRPEWIRAIPNVGPKTLDMIRIYLAMRGLTLLDDATVSFWMKNLQTATIGGQISLVDTSITEAFTILVDSQEKHPWTFQGFTENDKPVIQPIKWQSLGPSHGDYSVAGCEYFVHVERKSIQDALGTFLSHGERRDRWIQTLEFLAEIPHGHVVIEGTFGHCVAAIQPRGTRSKTALINEFIGSVMSWRHTYGLAIEFYDTRRIAEKISHRLLKRGWKFATEQKTANVADAQELIESLT